MSLQISMTRRFRIAAWEPRGVVGQAMVDKSQVRWSGAMFEGNREWQRPPADGRRHALPSFGAACWHGTHHPQHPPAIELTLARNGSDLSTCW